MPPVTGHCGTVTGRGAVMEICFAEATTLEKKLLLILRMRVGYWDVHLRVPLPVRHSVVHKLPVNVRVSFNLKPEFKLISI
jgi:hypothetical protein